MTRLVDPDQVKPKDLNEGVVTSSLGVQRWGRGASTGPYQYTDLGEAANLPSVGRFRGAALDVRKQNKFALQRGCTLYTYIHPRNSFVAIWLQTWLHPELSLNHSSEEGKIFRSVGIW